MGLAIIILEKVRNSLRGEITKWMFELKPGIYIGTLSALVRIELWKYIEKSIGVGNAFLIYPAQCEQKFRIISTGNCSRRIVDYDGLQLVEKTKLINSGNKNLDEISIKNEKLNVYSMLKLKKKEKSEKKKKAPKKIPYWVHQKKKDIIIPDWSPQNFPLNFIFREIFYPDICIHNSFSLSQQSSYWGYSPDDLWPKASIQEIAQFIQIIPELVEKFQKDMNINKFPFIITSIDIETTTHLPKAFEGFINIIGISQLQFSYNNNSKKITTSLKISQFFNMLRKRQMVPKLIDLVFKNLKTPNYFLVFNRNFDIKILKHVINSDSLNIKIPDKIFDLQSYFKSLADLESNLYNIYKIKRNLSTKSNFSYYYSLFKGEKSADGKRLIEPIGIYNIIDTLSPLLIFLHYGDKKFEENT